MPSLAAEQTAAARRSALAADPQVQALIAAAVSDDAVTDELTTWLANLFALTPLPFSTVVVNASMLPTEALRFFYVDPNWLAALFDGAVSIGGGTPQQNTAAQTAMDQLEQQALAQAKYGTGPACGFLLRSGVIAAYPRLVYTAYSDAGGTQTVQPLRLETLGPNFVIGIYPQPILQLDIQEPPEGMQFGFEPDKDGVLFLNLRYLNSTKPGTTPGKEIAGVDPIAVKQYLGRDHESTGTVLDVAALQAALQQQLNGQQQLPPSGQLGSAGFAVQMVVAPETQTFNLQTSQQADAKR
jgi:hypothetical protein